METPDFRAVRKMISEMKALDADFSNIFTETEQFKSRAAQECGKRLEAQARLSLGTFSVEELAASRAGIRTGALMEAGFRTLADLDKASDGELLAVSGIGEKQLLSIRSLLRSFVSDLAQRERIRLPGEEMEDGDFAFIQALALLRQAELICADGEDIREELHRLVTEKTEAVRVRGRLKWLFSGRKKRGETIRAIEDLRSLSRSPLCLRAQNLLDIFAGAVSREDEEVRSDFRKNSAAYYALLEKLTGGGAGQKVYGSIPEQLASEIAGEELDTSAFRGNLRAYQEFGTRYMLHQKRVLLGDEMGLGKTIQAIAAMAHLHSGDPERHFLIICPASVMTGWCREIAKFSTVRPFLLHGGFREDAFRKWKEQGGAAVTSYEGMSWVSGEVNNRMKLDMLVVDEAHYMKNPEAKRTKRIRLLGDEADRIVLMTGTPLENKVSEMCELIQFVRPDLAGELRVQEAVGNLTAFREMLAPVYLRRKREQVLAELPPITESEEWCAMTPSDLIAYEAAVSEGNFMAMRRVSFLQEDLTASAKGIRLRQLCEELSAEGRKTVVFSYFRESVRKAELLLKDHGAFVLTGSTPAEERQQLLDAFADAPEGSVLIAQIQAGGTGLNLQSASAVIFLEPQIKPSLTNQAVSRVYRMGQNRSVLVCHLLCEQTVDEAVRELVKPKQDAFDLYADESAMAEAEDRLADREWVSRVVEEQRRRYLPAVVQQ